MEPIGDSVRSEKLPRHRHHLLLAVVVHFRLDAVAVRLHRFYAEPHPTGDLAARESFSESAEDLKFAVRQSVEAGCLFL